MAIARVQSSDSGQQNNVAITNSYTINFSTPTSGNVLLLYVATQILGTTITTPTGWNLQENGATTPNAYLFYRVADGTEGTSLAISASANTHWNVWIGEYSGVDTGTVFAGSNSFRSGSSSGLGTSLGVENTYLGSLHLNFQAVIDTAGNVTIDAATRTDNPKSSTQINSSGGGVNAIYWTNSASSDVNKIWTRVYERILTGSDQSVTVVSEQYGSASNFGGGIACIVNPANGVAVAAQASGSGTAAFAKVNSGTWIGTATTFSTNVTGDVVVGDLLVVIAELDNGNATVTNTITTPANWTLYGGFPIDLFDIADSSTRSIRWYVFYRIATGVTDDTQTFSFDAAGTGGSWCMLTYTGPWAVAVGSAMEEGADSYKTSQIVAITTPVGDIGYQPVGLISTDGDSLQVCSVMYAGPNRPTTFINSFNSRQAATPTVPAVADRSTLVAGKASTNAAIIRNASTANRGHTGIIVGFRAKPAGNDHWGWAEAAATDSWQSVLV